MRLVLIVIQFLASISAAWAQPLVIGHRGASGYLPEHTLPAYLLAIEQGAHFIEPDLVMTKDGVLVARHENEISQTTDVAARPQFAGRRTTKTIGGKSLTGWFTEDFTLAELKTLRAKERIPGLRPASARHDGRYEIPAFSEVLDLVKSRQDVGVYPETKHAAYFASIGLAPEEPLVRLLHQHGFRGKDARAFIQSFDAASLKKLARLTEVPLIQLIGSRDRYDLADIASYARGIGPDKNLLIPRAPDGSLGTPTSLVRDAHARGLLVHGWTFRAENHFLPKEFRADAGPGALGDMAGELRRFLDLGMDGYFTDHPGNRGQAPINSRR
jgi:glycerophosphoryl diester phosphodiesterase